MAQDRHPETDTTSRPRWSQALRALREARGITQEGWAAQLGYGRATIRRWEAGETVPSADAEAAIIAICGEKQLFRTFADGPLAGVRVSPEWIADLLAAARLGTEPPPALAAPPVQYARSGEVSIAWQAIGDGPIDLVVTPGAISHREIDWEHPGAQAFFGQLAQFARVIVFDKRGTGMSDRVPTGTLEERMDDIRAVLDAAGSERAALFGVSEGGPMSIMCAATWPERITALILYGTYSHADMPPEDPQTQLERLQRLWGRVESPFLERFGPSAAANPAARAWWARYQRLSASPGAVLALNQMNATIDVRPALPTLGLPTLVLHRTGDRAIPVDQGEALAAAIPGARFLPLPGEDHLPWLGSVTDITDAVRRFLDEPARQPAPERILATVVHVTLDDATDAERVRAELTRCHGTPVAGDAGVLATFDGPTGAIHGAAALQVATRDHGGARIGIHIGEVTRSNGTIEGEPVRVAEALATRAKPGETLVSRTVADLATAPGITVAPALGAAGDDGGLRPFRVMQPGG